MNVMNRDLFWDLLEKEHAGAESFCRRLAADRDEGDDLYQEALLKAWRKFGGLRDVNAFRQWLYRIIVNLYKSRCRNPWRRNRVELDNEIIENLQIEDQSSAIYARRLLAKALGTISADDKTLIVLYELEGWSISELAGIYQKPEGTIKARLSRARRKMREELARWFEKNVNALEIEVKYAVRGCKQTSE